MTGTLAPWIITIFDNNGDKVSGAKVFAYATGTSTKLDTYSDVGLTTPNANPVIADSSGRVTMFLGPYTYDFKACPPTDTDPPTSPYYTITGASALAPFAAVTTVDVTWGENVSARDVVYLSDGTGGTTAGRWYRCDLDATYQSATPRIGLAQASGTTGNTGVVITGGKVGGFAGLTAGSTYYISSTLGAISTTVSYREVGVALSTTDLMVSPTPHAPVNVDVVGVAGQNLAYSQVCYQLSSDGEWYLARADFPASSTSAKNVGVCVGAGGANDPCVIRIKGTITGLAGLTAGSRYYISSSVAGSYTATAPELSRYIGTAGSTTTLVLDPSPASQGYSYIGAQVGNVGAGEDNLVTTPVLPANTLSYNSAQVNAIMFGSFAANVNNKTLKVYFGSTLVVSTGAAAFNNVGWTARLSVIRTTAGNQICNATVEIAGQTCFNGGVVTATENEATDITIKCTGESAAAASNDIIQRTMLLILPNAING